MSGLGKKVNGSIKLWVAYFRKSMYSVDIIFGSGKEPLLSCVQEKDALECITMA